MVENVVGVFGLPLGIALNFVVNGQDVLVPMAIEEPSVIAGASFMARLARAGGGFTANTSPSEMIGQMQVLDVEDLTSARRMILENKSCCGRGCWIDRCKPWRRSRDLTVRLMDDSPIRPFLVCMVYDARRHGRNAVNSLRIVSLIRSITGGRVHLHPV
jgi:hydroxymethylglutaryl-CoA reductase